MSRMNGIVSLFSGDRGRRPVRRRSRRSWLAQAERLESRALLTVTPTLIAPGVIQVDYTQISGQSAIIELEIAGTHNTPVVDFTADVNIYAPSNSATTPSSWFFPNISQIIVTVPGFDTPGVNNNSLTIKGLNSPSDRIIIGGAGRTAAGRWSSETAGGEQCLLSIEGIDDLTVTAGGTINVSGSFTNDTEDASIRAIGQIVERAAEQHTATVTIGETTPAVGVNPRPWLYSNTIEIVGAELDIYSTITATDRIDLRAGDSAPDTGRSNLVLPYDITVLGNPTTGDGVLSLFSTKNITQLQTSTILAPTVVAVSSVPRAATTDGPWMIDLGSATNDFDQISLGMTAAPGDARVAATEGRIGIRDVDDLAIVDFGILAATGRVRIDTAGPLSIQAPIQATGLILESDESVVSDTGAIMRLGDLGLTVIANSTFASTSSGDVTLAGPITILDDTPAALVVNKIFGAGTVTISGGLYSPHAGSTTVAGAAGVVLSGPVQVGSTKLDANSKAIEIFDHDLNLTSAAGGIDVGPVPGNDATPFAVQATNIITLDAPLSITIAGSVFAGTIYGDPSDLTETQALPAITIRGLADVKITATGSLRTQAYETDPDQTINPLVGKISITAATQLNSDGAIVADGAVDIAIPGDVYLYGPTTARENVTVRTTSGSIDVQGPVLSTGGTYTTAPVAGSQRVPNVILSAPFGSISTSGLGTLAAGTVTARAGATYGGVVLTALQDIVIAADIDTPGPVSATSKLGMFDLSALVEAGNKSPVSITAANGIVESDLDFGRIVADSVTLLNTGAAGGASDIDLQGKLNQMGTVTATNLAVGGSVFISGTTNAQGVRADLDVSIQAAQTGKVAQIVAGGVLSVTAPDIGDLRGSRVEVRSSSGIAVNGDIDAAITLAMSAKQGITQIRPIRAPSLTVTNDSNTAVTLGNPLNNVSNVAIRNLGAVTYVDADDFETGVNRTAPLGVEIAGDAVSLSSVAPFSTVRVVSGLSYRTLSIAAGTQSGTTVGNVEFVTTSSGDNTNQSPFAGTLRDMIRYARSNAAVYTINGAQRRQPMALVFDESGYPVQEISVASNIPVINVPIKVLGSRLEQSVLAAGVERVGIAGTPAVQRGLTFGRGSEESLVDSVAMHGFSQGTSLFVVSGGNTFQNLRVGMNDAGVPNANRIGLLLTNSTAVNNLVGGLELDDSTDNLFVANRAAGIFIDAGASGNRIVGNVIGDETGSRPDFANGDGVRIRASSGNLIGAADSGVASYVAGNVIAGNTSSGVLVLNANSGTTARANRIQNNLIERNSGAARSNVGAGAGVLVVGSSFVDIGGEAGRGNTLLRQGQGTADAVDGVRIVDSASVRVRGNAVGVDLGTQATAGNTGSGISIADSTNVEVSGRNTIGGNRRDGITIADGSTGVQVADNLVGLFDTGGAAGNQGDGIAINAAVGNTIGLRNRIAFNRNGVRVADGHADTLAAGNRVFGSEMFANLEAGVRLVGGSGATVGSLTSANANLIRNNGGDGIRIEWSAVSGAASGHAIQGNFIGTDRNAGVNGLGNGGAGIVVSGGTGNTIANGNVVMNNAGAGIELRGGSGNVVGGTAVAAGNRIMNNAGSGVVLAAAVGTPSTLRDAREQTVAGNTIRDNGGHGIEVRSGTASATIGQRVTNNGVSGLSNAIHGNAGYGVSVAAGAQRVSTQGNSVFENLAGGFSVAGGSNRSAARSITLTRAEIRQPSGGGEQLVVTGSLANAGYAQQQYSVDIYASLPDEGDYMSLTGYQARRFLGRATVMTNAQGVATFELRITASIDVGEVITATATALRFEAGSSSVMSNAVTADYPGIPTPRY